MFNRSKQEKRKSDNKFNRRSTPDIYQQQQQKNSCDQRKPVLKIRRCKKSLKIKYWHAKFVKKKYFLLKENNNNLRCSDKQE